MNLYNELHTQGYIRENGMVAHHPTEFCENYFLFTAVAAYVAELTHDYESEKKLKKNAFVFKEKCKIQNTGLYHRDYTRPDRQISHDELVGISSMFIYDALAINNRGIKHFLSYDNVGQKFFTLRSFFGRFLFFPYHAIYTLSKYNPLTYLFKFLYLCDVFFTALSPFKEVSGMQLIWISMGRTWRNFPFAYSVWSLIMNARYKDVSEMLGQYYKTPNNPIVEATKGISF